MNTQENTWYPVARTDDLHMRHVFQGQLHGVELALWRTDDGRVNAWENRCPHRSVRFTLGVNTGKKLRCQYHGWQYQSGDGRCTFIPATSQTAPPPSLCAQTFAATEANGYVWVSLEAKGTNSCAVAFSPEFTPLPLALRSLTFNAGLDVVAAELARYADYDEDAVPGSSALLQNRAEIDLAWQTGSGGREVRFWLQPANEAKTIVHGSANLVGMDERETLRWHNRLLTTLRRHVENRESSAGHPPLAEAVAKLHLIPIVQSASRNTASSGRTLIRTTVAARWNTAEDIVAFKLALLDGERVDFDAGAHLDVHTPNGLVRQYSLVNAPGERDHLVIGVKLEPASRGGSRSLHESLQVGDSLTVAAPKNHFPLVPDEGGVLIAGGIGITPILAMGASLQHAGLSYALHYFARSKEHVAFKDRLAELDGLQLHTGLTVDATRDAVDAAFIAAGSEHHVYVCGPRPLIDLVRERAAVNGIADARVHFELFANEVSHDADKPFRVRLQTSGAEFVVPAGVSLSDTLKAHGIVLDTSCEQGVCGTCRTGVVDGEPEHRDVYLNEDEKQSQRCLMPCVSRSRSELLVLDL
ncbi:Rieske 2Fe-2S domain-containing protein [Pseudomonas serbica]|jgi:ferredoxin-NADP reductase/nitrite reductase/ring-hydroxylating ferredoxin subunit|uniref:Rieske 2Fe-2S domain-containing protein n=1 Tax=Pseudomonas serbica TaxID=2965074 RepID=UPI00237C14F0|nr:Rieske 2Fe-2S domain-containing protein [Pseudomonas serbica]